MKVCFGKIKSRELVVKFILMAICISVSLLIIKSMEKDNSFGSMLTHQNSYTPINIMMGSGGEVFLMEQE